MKITFAELKLRARRSLVGNFGTLAGIQITMYAVTVLMVPLLYLIMIPVILGTVFFQGTAATAMFMVTLLAVFLVLYFAMLVFVSLLGAGFARIMLDIAQAQPAEFKRLLFPFKNHFLRFAGITGLLMLLGILCAVPGIIMSLFEAVSPGYLWVKILMMIAQYVLTVWVIASFSQSFHILLDHPDKKAVQCMRESYEMMQGNRLRLIFLQLSFIGWYLLIYLSFGVGMIWVLPYVGCTGAHFYLDLRERRRLAAERENRGAPDREAERETERATDREIERERSAEEMVTEQ